MDCRVQTYIGEKPADGGELGADPVRPLLDVAHLPNTHLSAFYVSVMVVVWNRPLFSNSKGRS